MRGFIKAVKKNRNSFLVFSSSLILSFLVINYFLPIIEATIFALNLLFHEFGHWIIARTLDLDPRLPVFIPLGILVFGITNIKDSSNLTLTEKKALYSAGGISSILLLLSMLATPVIAIPSLTLISMLITYEIMNMTIGIDGRKIINARRDAIRKEGATI